MNVSFNILPMKDQFDSYKSVNNEGVSAQSIIVVALSIIFSLTVVAVGIWGARKLVQWFNAGSHKTITDLAKEQLQNAEKNMSASELLEKGLVILTSPKFIVGLFSAFSLMTFFYIRKYRFPNLAANAVSAPNKNLKPFIDHSKIAALPFNSSYFCMPQDNVHVNEASKMPQTMNADASIGKVMQSALKEAMEIKVIKQLHSYKLPNLPKLQDVLTPESIPKATGFFQSLLKKFVKLDQND